MKAHRLWLTAACPVVAVALAACGGSYHPASKSTPKPASQVFTYDTLTTVMPDGWDPAREYSNGIIAMSNMYETLTRYNPVTHHVDPLLATSWSTAPNGLTWTFQLRHGVHFHTGRLMTAAAVKSAIMRMKNIGGGASYIWGSVKSISTPSQYTVVFHLSYPSPLALEASADYSAYIYDTKAAGPGGNLSTWLNAPHDAGTGPYELQTWNKGQELEVILKAFPGYWGGWKGPHFKKVVFRDVPQDTTAAQLLRSGQVSFVEQLRPSLFNSFKNTPGIRLVTAPSWQNLLAQLNTKVLSLPIRQAISYGTNYAGIIAALQGAAVQSSGIVPPGLFGHFTNLPNYGYDPKKAIALLHSVGYGPGRKPLNLSLTYTAGDSNEQVVATLLKSSMAKLNINLSVQPLAWPTQWGKAKSASASAHQDIFIEYWWPDYADPYSWFINLVHSEKTPFFNLSYYSNPALDHQINQIEPLVATKPAAASSLYRQMQVELFHQAPIVYLYNNNYQYAMLNSFSGFQVNPAYPNVVFVYNLRPQAS
jgi:peptide/nickel transport system substrate-binding protein